MRPQEIEALYMTAQEVAVFLDVAKSRVHHLANAGQIIKLKGSVFSRESVEGYKDKRGNRRGGRYPKPDPDT
jgi:hypothetical protein